MGLYGILVVTSAPLGQHRGHSVSRGGFEYGSNLQLRDSAGARRNRPPGWPDHTFVSLKPAVLTAVLTALFCTVLVRLVNAGSRIARSFHGGFDDRDT
jgi:hypothetical protein